ncbi:MAG: S41 family peptidase [Kangiellaceae bacterium]|nr:S41 family peptidase [Kangiellaceae bacterium]
MNSIRLAKHSMLASTLVLGLLACGGGDNFGQQPPTSNDLTWTMGTFQAASVYKNFCQSPRSGTDINGNTFPDQQGSTAHENFWLRSWSNDTYLWYDELPDLNPNSYSDTLTYFGLLKTDATTPSGNPRDKFHFTYNTAEYQQLVQSGTSVSYGIDWLLTSSTPPRDLYIRFIEPGSPAANPSLNLARGVRVLEIDGVNFENGTDTATLNAGLYPSTDGESHTFTVLDAGASQSRQVTITATEVTADPVPLVDTYATNSGTVGYIYFNDHNFVSEDRLYEAMTQMSNANVSDLVLDLRYNGGGLLYIASQLSYMIAGATATNNRTFELVRFNDKHPTTNPVTGQAIQPTPFYNSISQYSDTYAQGTPLPSLSLNRVFILSTAGTCSASEAIINALRGINIEVILIGETTCGKPYGFYATDNCGTTYFTIQFDGVNDQGQGGYSDGFSPTNTPSTPGELITGCYVEDDITSVLGDQADPLIAAALNYRVSGSCPTISMSQRKSVKSDIASQAARRDKADAIKVPVKFNQKIYLN